MAAALFSQQGNDAEWKGFGEFFGLNAFVLIAYGGVFAILAMVVATADAGRVNDKSPAITVELGENDYRYIGFIDGKVFLLDRENSTVRIQELSKLAGLDLIVRPPIEDRLKLPFQLWPKWWASIRGTDDEQPKDESSAASNGSKKEGQESKPDQEKPKEINDSD